MSLNDTKQTLYMLCEKCPFEPIGAILAIDHKHLKVLKTFKTANPEIAIWYIA